METEDDGFHLGHLEFGVCEPSRLRRPVRHPRGTYLQRYILLVPGDADAVGLNEITWENGTHSGAQRGVGGEFKRTPT